MNSKLTPRILYLEILLIVNNPNFYADTEVKLYSKMKLLLYLPELLISNLYDDVTWHVQYNCTINLLYSIRGRNNKIFPNPIDLLNFFIFMSMRYLNSKIWCVNTGDKIKMECPKNLLPKKYRKSKFTH